VTDSPAGTAADGSMATRAWTLTLMFNVEPGHDTLARTDIVSLSNCKIASAAADPPMASVGEAMTMLTVSVQTSDDPCS